MTVRVIRPFGPYDLGATFDPPSGQADLLIRRGMVVEHKEEHPVKKAEKQRYARR